MVGAQPQGEEPWVLKAAAELANQTGAELGARRQLRSIRPVSNEPFG